MKLRSMMSCSESVSSEGKRSRSVGWRRTVFCRLFQRMMPSSLSRVRMARAVERLTPSWAAISGSEGSAVSVRSATA
ncbi:hypothetical protein RCCGEPOP_05297 [Rhizobium sp. Pop5]|nr:hypothetical protein RCCGEPOP_05297 [Rhizobium sp. Pop5]